MTRRCDFLTSALFLSSAAGGRAEVTAAGGADFQKVTAVMAHSQQLDHFSASFNAFYATRFISSSSSSSSLPNPSELRQEGFH